MKYTAVSVRQLDRKGKPWQARANRGKQGQNTKIYKGSGKNLVKCCQTQRAREKRNG